MTVYILILLGASHGNESVPHHMHKIGISVKPFLCTKQNF